MMNKFANDIKEYLNLNKEQAIIILCGVYIFLSLVSNIASTKIIRIFGIATDAGIVYYLLFTWRDLIHKQFGKKVAITTIISATILNILAALLFQLVAYWQPDASWAASGGQAAWVLIFGLQLRIVIASIIGFITSEFVDTMVYEWWTKNNKDKPQYLRVFISNGISIPIDTLLFVLIAFTGMVSNSVLIELIITNIILKIAFTLMTFWLIYLVPEKPIYN
jgi:queuosine precursor transporter